MLEIPRVEDNGRLGPVNSALVPRYGGAPTYALLPRLDEAAAAGVAPEIKVVGVPFDAGVSYRPGARFGSGHVRQSSRLLRPYNPATDTSPFAQAQVVDAGDMAVNPFDIGEAIEAIQQDAMDLTEDGSSLMTIGGDHTIALPLLRAASARAGEPVALLHFDAHCDTWTDHFGERSVEVGLGPVRVIDPTGRACQTDVLAGWPSYGSGVGQATTVDEIVVTGSRNRAEMAMAPPPPPAPAAGQAPSEAQIEAARLALQPPLQVMTDSACVIYGLN